MWCFGPKPNLLVNTCFQVYCRPLYTRKWPMHCFIIQLIILNQKSLYILYCLYSLTLIKTFIYPPWGEFKRPTELLLTAWRCGEKIPNTTQIQFAVYSPYLKGCFKNKVVNRYKTQEWWANFWRCRILCLHWWSRLSLELHSQLSGVGWRRGFHPGQVPLLFHGHTRETDNHLHSHTGSPKASLEVPLGLASMSVDCRRKWRELSGTWSRNQTQRILRGKDLFDPTSNISWSNDKIIRL